MTLFDLAPGAFKVDFAVEGGVPWANPDVGRAGTVHLGGGFAEIAFTEREIQAGRMPERPFVLARQQHLADPNVRRVTSTRCTATRTCRTATPGTPRRRSSHRPYHLGVPGMFLCSAATPPGPGVHGMCGANAARQALRYLRRQGVA